MKKILLTLIIASFQIPAFVSGQTVVLGTGTAISVFSPLNRSNDYCVYEVIYFQNQINLAGNISALAFQRHDGSNTDSIENVNIYMKHTANAQMVAGNFDTSGYTLVFSGTFPNDSGPGWREVNLNAAFTYDNLNNLQVLVEKGYQPAVANTPVTPRWIYTNTGTPARARRYYGNVAISNSTALTVTNFTSNARLTFGATGVAEINPGSFSVYPNPSSGSISFYNDNSSQDLKLQLISVTGALIYDNDITGQETIKIDGLAPGIYFYNAQVQSSNSVSRGKIIVTR